MSSESVGKFSTVALFLVSAIFIVNFISPVFAMPFETELISYWLFDEEIDTTIFDSSGNDNTGTFYGSNNGTIYGATWTGGKYGKALSFDGIDDYVRISNPFNINMKEITIEAWLYAENWTDDNPGAGIVAFDTAGKSEGGGSMTCSGVGLVKASTSAKIRILLCGVYNKTLGNINVESSVELQPNQWSHVAFTLYESTNGSVVSIYINGNVDKNKQLYDVFKFNITSDIFIGSDGKGANLSAIIDNVRTYNRALSAEEISQHYQSSKDHNPALNDSGLIGYWDFNEGSGSTAKDSSMSRTSPSNCKHGSCLAFDGRNDYVYVPNLFPSTLNLQNLTVETWVYSTNWTDDQPSAQIVGFDTNATTGGGGYLLCPGSGLIKYSTTAKVRFLICGTGGPTWNPNVISNIELQPNQWYHVVGAVNKTFMGLYINGNLEGNLSMTDFKFNITSNKIFIGANLSATIDNVRIYNRALSAEEVGIRYSDETAPIITDITANPSIAAAGAVINITANLTDRDSGVNTAKSIIQKPDGVFNQSLPFIYLGNDIYHASLNTTGFAKGVYFVDISVADVAGNIMKGDNTAIIVLSPLAKGTYVSPVSIVAGQTTSMSATTSPITTVNLGINMNASATGSVALIEYNSTENQTVGGFSVLGKFIQIEISSEIKDNLQWAWLNISYSQSEVDAAGIDESTLRVWYYNSTINEWIQESDSGVDTINNYVWANVTHFSLYGIYGNQFTPSPSPPTGGSVYVSSLCTENWVCTNWSECIKGTQTRTCTDLNKCGTFKNKTNENQSCVPPAVCGNGMVESGEECESPRTCTINGYAGLQDCISCKYADCIATESCGDGICNGMETYETCPADCLKPVKSPTGITGLLTGTVANPVVALIAIAAIIVVYLLWKIRKQGKIDRKSI